MKHVFGWAILALSPFVVIGAAIIAERSIFGLGAGVTLILVWIGTGIELATSE